MKDRERVRKLYRQITNANWIQALAVKARDDEFLFTAIAMREKANDELLQLAESWNK
jgi:hypothetical protein